MGTYYYLVSQLPFLMYGQKPPMSSEAFRNLARPILDASDAAIFDMISLDPQPVPVAHEIFSYADTSPSCGSDFIDNWREWERALRLNLAKRRAAKVMREGAMPIEPPAVPSDAVTAATRVVSGEESPLEAEILLDKARWSAIDSLQGINYFDRNIVFAYLLKLLILERHSLMQTETGLSAYKSLYASIIESGVALGGVSGITPAGEAK